MKKITLIIILLAFTFSYYSCTIGDINPDDNSAPLAGQVYFYTPNETTQLYLFSQGIDFGNAVVVSDFNENIPIDSLLLAELPITSYDHDTHVYEFIAKRIAVDDPVVVGNIIIEGDDISVESITGTFALDTMFVELGIPSAVIRINE